MSDPLTYSNDVSNYAKSSTTHETIQYILGKSSDSNLAPGTTTYSQFYNQGLDPSVYASEFVLGHSPAAVNPYILPGDRYNLTILDKKYDSNGNMISSTNKQCFDVSGKSHDLSSIIDNVNKTAVLRDSSNQGLFYSLYASLNDYNKGITNIDLSKNSYLCKPITTYMDDSGKKKTTPAYILTSDTEGFTEIDSAAYQDVSAIIMSSGSNLVPSPGFVPGFIPASSNAVNPAIIGPDGKPQIDKLGIPMYVNDGEGGGPTQQNLNSPTVQTNQKIMKQLLPETGTVAENALDNIKKLFGAKNIPSTDSAFTTIESSDIILQQYQNPWEDPIFLFYIGSLGLLFGCLIYRLIQSKNR